MTDARLPPHNPGAERAVLGSAFVKPAVFPLLNSSLGTDDFFVSSHREIFQAMQECSRRRMPLDLISVGDQLAKAGQLARLEGGEGYLARVVNDTPTAENVGHYVRIVQEAAERRRLIELCARTMSRAYGDSRSEALLDEHSTDLARIVMRTTDDLVRAGDLVGQVLEDAEARMLAGPEASMTGVRVGVSVFDDLTGGFDPTDLVVIAADPGGGKTALALQAAHRHVIEQAGTALVINLEMPSPQLVQRMIIRAARVNSHRVRRGKIDREEFQRLYDHGLHLVDKNLYVESRVRTMRQIWAKARTYRARHPKERGYMVVDYLQMITAQNKDSRAQQVSQFARELKDIAKTLDLPVVAVSTLGRDAAKRKTRPTMHDLKESGDIEYAADTIFLLHNADETDDGPIDAICEKNRKGPTGVVPLHWIGRFYEFTDVGDAPTEPEQQALPITA